jgi:hypothetical protein
MSWVSGHHETLTISARYPISVTDSVRLAMRFAWVTITPRGSVVDPEVYWR